MMGDFNDDDVDDRAALRRLGTVVCGCGETGCTAMEDAPGCRHYQAPTRQAVAAPAVTTGKIETVKNVDHPPHYNRHPSGVECIDVVQHMNFNVGNAMKYLWRSDHKHGLEDLKKAEWYVRQEIDRLSSAG